MAGQTESNVPLHNFFLMIHRVRKNKFCFGKSQICLPLISVDNLKDQCYERERKLSVLFTQFRFILSFSKLNCLLICSHLEFSCCLNYFVWSHLQIFYIMAFVKKNTEIVLYTIGNCNYNWNCIQCSYIWCHHRFICQHFSVSFLLISSMAFAYF